MPIGVTVAQAVGRSKGHPNWHHLVMKLPDSMYPSDDLPECANEIHTLICPNGTPRRGPGIRWDDRQVFDVGLNGKPRVLMALEMIKPTQATSFVTEACGQWNGR